MYKEFYGLRELPFELTSNRRFLLMTVGHREALSVLHHGVHARKSITLLVGEAGTGKTTLIRALLKGMEGTGAGFLSINNPRLTRDEFVETIASGFGLSSGATRSKATMLVEVEQALKARAAAGRMTALVVDEAQSLSDDLLEEIRLLANIESDSTKLLPVVLAGQPELADRLNRPGLRQLKQRVSIRCDLQPLTLNETASYVIWRVQTAGGDARTIFTRGAVEAIHEISAGIPRMINTLCDNALLTGFAADCRPVTREIVAEVCVDLDLPAVAVRGAADTVVDSKPLAPPSTALEPGPMRNASPAPASNPPPRFRILGL